MHRSLALALVAVSFAGCSRTAGVLPQANSPAAGSPAIVAASPALGIAINGTNAKFATGTQAAGFRFAGLLRQGVKLAVSGTTAKYTYALTTASTAITITTTAAKGQYYVTPKLEVAKAVLKATATPVGGGKTIAATLSLQVVPMIYAASYPGESGAALGVYAPWSTAPIAQFPENAPSALDVDTKGNVWLANGTTIEEYSAGLFKHLRTISGLTKTSAVAVDALGNAYCVDNYGVKEFGPKSGSTPTRTFGSSAGITSATWVAVDSSNNAYISDFYSSAVWVYAPGTSTTSLRSLTKGVTNPRIVTISGNNVYVANNSPDTTIPRFPVGSTTSNGTYGTSSGLAGPSYLAVDGKGNVFAALDNLGTGNVVEYAATSFASPTRAMNLLGGGNPAGLATDPLGNLYVANGADYVDVFVPGTSTSPSYSVGGPSSGPYSPSAVAVWP